MSAHSTGPKTAAHGDAPESVTTRYFVIPAPEGGWHIFKDGRKHPLQWIRNKITAMETAKMMAKREAPAQVMVQRPNGLIHLRYNFTEKPPF